MGRAKIVVPEEVKQQMIRDNKRMPYQQVAKIYGIGRNKTFEIVRGTCKKKAGVKNMTNSRKYKAIAEDYLQGLSIKKLTIKYGYSRQGIYNVLMRQGVELLQTKSKRRNRILEDLKAGEMTQSQIAKKHSCSRQYVNQLLSKLNKKSEVESDG